MLIQKPKENEVAVSLLQNIKYCIKYPSFQKKKFFFGKNSSSGDPCQSFSPWPAPQSPGRGAVIPCSFIINVKDDQQLVVLERVQSAVNNMAERSVLKITII